jgi:hypothetical protein
MKVEIRDISIRYVNGHQISDQEKIKISKFISYLEAYCAELNDIDIDVLIKDEKYNFVYGLYESSFKQ